MKTAALIVVAGALLALQGAEPVIPVNRQPDMVVAEAVLSPSANSDEDCSERLQRALDETGHKGGGTVFLKLGVYTVAKPINVPVGVTLRGDYPASRNQLRNSTVLAIKCGRGEVDGKAAFTVNPGAGLVGLVFHYPEQTLANPAPYPWTVRTALNPPVANDNQSVVNCTFVNSWKGISIGPEWNELHTIRSVRMCALHTGIAIDSVTDIGRMTDVCVAPWVWAWFGGGAPSREELRRWFAEHDAVGVDCGRSDWEFVRNLRVFGYRTGVRFRKGERGLTNAVIADSKFTGCGTALALDELNGVGLAVYRSWLGGGKTVAFGPKFNSVAQFYGCRFEGETPKNGRFAIVRDVHLPEAKPEVPALPRPRRSAFFDVTKFGASSELEDNAPAFQKALDAAKAGGTVYVPAGRYRFRGNFKVPFGVELRGCSDVPHHTCSGGSVLMPYQGRGEEGGEPFVSLAAGSGLRGLAFWYPEQTTISPVPYPWTVQSLGPGCWIRDVNIGNGWQGADFASHPSDGHFISYLSGCCWRRALFVGKAAKGGYVEDLQFNPHYSLRRARGLPVAKNPPKPEGKEPNAGWEAGWLRDHLEGFVFRDCVDEKIVGTFLYAAKDGLAFHGANRVKMLIHGTDTGSRGLVLDQRPGSLVEAALTQLVPWNSTADVEKSAIWCSPGDAGEGRFAASQFWAGPETMIQRGRGTLTLDSLNSSSGPMAVYAGKATIVAARYGNRNNAHVDVHGGQVRAEGVEIRKIKPAEQKEAKVK